MPGEPRLSLIIPAHNEAGRVPRSLRRVIEFSACAAFSYEVLVVVEKSTDGTLELAREIAAKQANFQIIDNGRQLRHSSGLRHFAFDAATSKTRPKILASLDCAGKYPPCVC